MLEEILKEDKIKVVLVGVDLGEDVDFQHSLDELKSLAEACDKEVVGVITQKMSDVNKAYYIGAGKISEVRDLASRMEAQEVIFDNTLSPSQIRNLTQELDLPVSDRTNLILDIFAVRAQTKEAKLQVETARLKYMLPRLIGMRESLGRQGGASGSLSNKGSGEKKLELDRRKIEHRISELEKELKIIASNRMTQRKRRDDASIPKVALVGYTNAGKSTILNRMVEYFGGGEEKKVLEKNMLFATLETNVRLIEPGDNKSFFLSDTVGFIDKLPHGLIKAFQSTLEEVRYADLIVQVVDFSDESFKQHMDVTEQTLKELEASGIPQLVVYNKCDLKQDMTENCLSENMIYLSAHEREAIYRLAELIQQKLYAKNVDCCMLIPYDKGSIVSYLCNVATVMEQEYRVDGVFLRLNCREQDKNKYREYLI